MPNTFQNNENLMSLIWSNKNLRALPSVLKTFKKLKILNLDDNFITDLSSVDQMTNLDSLYLSGNNRGYIELDHLNNSNGQFETTLSDIMKLKNLKSLHLSRNFLKTIPTEIHCLESLIILDISNNKIAEIPNTIKSLSKLVFLNASRNFINGLSLNRSDQDDYKKKIYERISNLSLESDEINPEKL